MTDVLQNIPTSESVIGPSVSHPASEDDMIQVQLREVATGDIIFPIFGDADCFACTRIDPL